MYIEFYLPMGAGGHTAAWANKELSREIEDWSVRYNIPYTTKIIKYTKRLVFNEDRFYNFFILTWKPKTRASFWANYRLITDLNNKT